MRSIGQNAALPSNLAQEHILVTIVWTWHWLQGLSPCLHVLQDMSKLEGSNSQSQNEAKRSSSVRKPACAQCLFDPSACSRGHGP